MKIIYKIYKHQLSQFIIVGFINTCFGYGFYFIFLLFRLSPDISLFLSNIFGYSFNYFTIGRLVFGSSGLGALPLFLVVAAIVYSTNLALLTYLISLDMNPVLSQLLCLPIVVTLNFVMMRRLVFKSK